MTENADYQEMEGASPVEILKWVSEKYGEDAVFTSSFGAEDMVIMDMMARNKIGAKIATIDTGRLPQETYDLMDRSVEKYGLEVLKYFPDYNEVEKMINEKGMNLFYKSVENRKLCCNIRKVQPLNRLLEGRKAWITGLRADQTSFRKKSRAIEVDKGRGIIKINPLLAWTSEDVWDYIRANDVPYSTLHDEGYPSIGCLPCTRAVKPGEDERAGRWWWEEDVKECGLHLQEGSTQEGPEFSIAPSHDRKGR